MNRRQEFGLGMFFEGIRLCNRKLLYGFRQFFSWFSKKRILEQPPAVHFHLDQRLVSQILVRRGVHIAHKCANALHDPASSGVMCSGECCMSAARKLMKEESTGSSSVFLLFGSGSATTSMRPGPMITGFHFTAEFGMAMEEGPLEAQTE